MLFVAVLAIINGLLIDGLNLALKPSVDRVTALRLFAFLVPVVTEMIYFFAIQMLHGIAWVVHLWVGSIVLAGVVGLLLSYLLVPCQYCKSSTGQCASLARVAGMICTVISKMIRCAFSHVVHASYTWLIKAACGGSETLTKKTNGGLFAATEGKHYEKRNTSQYTETCCPGHCLPWGPLILAEFAFGVAVCSALGLWSFLSPIRFPFMIVIGCFFLLVALNYVTLLLYAMSIVRRKSAHQEVAFELAHKDTYARKYTLQTTVFLLVPLVLPLLAVYQEVHHRWRQVL